MHTHNEANLFALLSKNFNSALLEVLVGVVVQLLEVVGELFGVAELVDSDVTARGGDFLVFLVSQHDWNN